MDVISIVNIEDEPIVTRSYTAEAFLNMCNDKLHTDYTIEEINKATRAFLDKYNYLEIHINPLITEEEPVNKYKQALDEIEEIAEEQIPYLNIDKAKTTIEVEYDYANKIYDLEQRMYKILQKISEYKGEYNEKIR